MLELSVNDLCHGHTVFLFADFCISDFYYISVAGLSLYVCIYGEIKSADNVDACQTLVISFTDTSSRMSVGSFPEPWLVIT